MLTRVYETILLALSLHASVYELVTHPQKKWLEYTKIRYRFNWEQYENEPNCVRMRSVAAVQFLSSVCVHVCAIACVRVLYNTNIVCAYSTTSIPYIFRTVAVFI